MRGLRNFSFGVDDLCAIAGKMVHLRYQKFPIPFRCPAPVRVLRVPILWYFVSMVFSGVWKNLHETFCTGPDPGESDFPKAGKPAGPVAYSVVILECIYAF